VGLPAWRGTRPRSATGVIIVSAPAIVVDSLKKTYRDGWIFRRQVEALRGVSFAVERGTIFGLLGPNGAGKTTLIKVLIGIVRKTAGGAELLGYPAGDRRGRRSVGYLPETHRIPRHHTANSALEYYGALSGLTLREIRKRRGPLLETVGLAKWGDTPVAKFSKGMQQRLGLAQAMLHDPELLILDEPTDGVDPVGRSEMRRVLRDLKDQGKTVFINSHLLQEIELVCDKVAIMNRGRVQRFGRIEELTQRSEMECGLVLRGDQERVRQVLDRQGLSCPPDETLVASPHEASELRMTVRLADQGAVDRLVDALRGEGISLLEMTRRRDTLEEAFLGIVREQPSS